MNGLRTRGILVVLVALPTVSFAQGKRWERQVRAHLERAITTLQDSSRHKGQVLRVRTLNAEESESFVLEMTAGNAYDVVGVCDEDCSRLQLLLSTATGNDLAVDRSSETFPVLRITPPTSGAYRIKVTMAACRLNPCWYGLAMLGP